MSGLLALRDAAMEGIKAEMPDLHTVEAVKGRITQRGLQRLSMRPPAVAVGVLGMRNVIKGGEAGVYRANVIMVAFLVTSGRDRVDQGLELAEKLILTIGHNTWGLRHTEYASEIEAETLYDDRVAKARENKADFAESGLFMQGVSWLQITRIARTAPSTGAGRADDREEADALGQCTDPRAWPAEIAPVITHPKGYK